MISAGRFFLMLVSWLSFFILAWMLITNTVVADWTRIVILVMFLLVAFVSSTQKGAYNDNTTLPGSPNRLNRK